MEQEKLNNVTNGDNHDNRPVAYRRLRTVALFTSFLGLGLAASVYGPTLVSMEILLDTNTKTISIAYSGNALGYLTGALICGFIYAPLNKELLFAMALFGIGLMTALAPFSWHVIIFIAVFIIQGFFMAIIDAAGQSYILYLWEKHKYKESIMQAAHGVWSVGSTSGPFIIRPFLADIKKSTEDRNISSVLSGNHTETNIITDTYNTPLNISRAFTVEYSNSGTELPPLNSTDNLDLLKERVSFVRIAFVVIAALILVCSVMFIAAWWLLKPSCCDHNRQKKKKETKKSSTESSRSIRITLLIIMFIFYFFYLWVEGIPGAYIAVFVVKGLGWPNNYGALVTSAYWGAHGMGRLLGIPIAMRMTAQNMLISDMIITALGFSILLFVPYLDFLVWIGIIIAGLGMGTIFASGILWLEEYVKITGAAASALVFASSLGAILGPLLTGYLFDEFSHMSVVYVIFTASLVEIIVFFVAYLFAQRNKIHLTAARKITEETKSLEIDPANEGVNSVAADEKVNPTA